MSKSAQRLTSDAERISKSQSKGARAAVETRAVSTPQKRYPIPARIVCEE